MSVGHASKELVSRSPSGVISTEGSHLSSIPTMSSPGSVGRFSRQHQWRKRSSTLQSLPSQRGPISIPFFTAPVSAATRFDPQCFPVLLLRRLWCQLPLSSATCQCGQPLDSRGHHRGACANTGVLGRPGLPESAEKQVKESPRTSGFRIWTSCQCQGWTTVAWKW